MKPPDRPADADDGANEETRVSARGTTSTASGVAASPSGLEQVRAEVRSVIETADGIARDGLQPGSDGPSVLAGLISQLAQQVDRWLAANGAGGSMQQDVRDAVARDAEASTEEDASPDDAPAEPSRSV
jgi:hypothetical protein